jgi:phage repressor protein C with HTH and peptisase S24 domain
MTVGTNIRKLRTEKGLTLNQLAAEIGSDVGNLSRLERGVQGYTDPVLKKIADALSVPVAAFFAEDDAQLASLLTLDFMPVRVVDDDHPEFVKIPKVKLRLSAGIQGFQTDPETYDGSTVSVHHNWILRNGFTRENLMAMRVKGESMEPTLYEDDLVIINLADKRMVDGQVYAINYEGEAVIKRLVREGGQWYLYSDNPSPRYGKRSCQGAECIVIGKVVKREGERF